MPLSDVAILAVEASWSTNPDDAPSWQSIPEAESIALVGRGRTYELDESTPATGKVRVDNTAGTYTNGATIGASTALIGTSFGGGSFGGGVFALTSSSSGTVTTDKRIRATATISGTPYTLFDHVITACPTTTPIAGQYGFSEFSTVDYLDALGGVTLRPAYIEHTLYEGPTHFWTFGDPPGSTSAVDLVTGTSAAIEAFYSAAGTVAGAAAFGGDPFFTDIDDTTNLAFTPHLDIDGVADGARYVVLGRSGKGAFLTGTKWGFRLTFSTVDVNGGYLLYQANYNGTADDPLQLTIGSSGDMSLTVPGLSTYAWAGPYNDGVEHTIQVISNTSSVRLWVDGVLETTLGIPTTLGTRGRLTIGGGVATANKQIISPFSGQIGYVAFFDDAFIDSGKSFTAHYSATTGYEGESCDTRISRILTQWAGYGGTVSLDASTTPMGPQSCGGSTALDEILSAARSDDGIFYVAGDGTLTFRSRGNRYALSPVVTLGTSTLPVDADDLTFDYDRRLMVNDMFAARPNGSVYRFTDSDSVLAHRRRTPSGTVEFNVTTDTELALAANWYLYRYSEPRARLGVVRLNPHAASGLAVYAATLEPFDRIAITNLPSTAPASTMQFIVEQVSHIRISETEWTTELALSPWIPVLTLDDATYGALDSYPLGY